MNCRYIEMLHAPPSTEPLRPRVAVTYTEAHRRRKPERGPLALRHASLPSSLSYAQQVLLLDGWLDYCICGEHARTVLDIRIFCVVPPTKQE
ncbi:hypothetical protein CDAR_608961 [Caerostris darwini]|uniref:Uncharacterized protein n=1 Tax=Caerostris darwini TaxID=1538125 RepID=A0AAV4WJK2_9ARAC|nr:hypothetical protein CDAR_608961 [Caerostris darwini]